MLMPEIIRKKRDREELSDAEISFWIDGVVSDSIPDYQSAALLMAMRINGLSATETSALVQHMLSSGQRVDLSGIAGIKADKHSTGGVGDKTTMIVMPIAAAAGLKVAKMSGRGLGHTGGTLDKLEAIPGFNPYLSVRQLQQQVNDIGISIIGQTAELVPADRRIYALRDLTATVDSIPLIAASVMSKKLAIGADVLVLDVKYGSGALMRDPNQARELAQIMVNIAKEHNIRGTAFLTSMEQPLGHAVGNALEVKECVDVLQGSGPADLREVSLLLAAELLFLAGSADTREAALRLASQTLDSGAAFATFTALVKAQNGDSDFGHLPKSELVIPYKAKNSGYISAIDTRMIGLAALSAGAGRITKDQSIDPAAGLVIKQKLGAYVEAGTALVDVHCSRKEQYAQVKELLDAAITINDKQPKQEPLILASIS